MKTRKNIQAATFNALAVAALTAVVGCMPSRPSVDVAGNRSVELSSSDDVLVDIADSAKHQGCYVPGADEVDYVRSFHAYCRGGSVRVWQLGAELSYTCDTLTGSACDALMLDLAPGSNDASGRVARRASGKAGG